MNCVAGLNCNPADTQGEQATHRPPFAELEHKSHAEEYQEGGNPGN